MNTFPRYIMREEILQYDESYVKVLEMIQCLAEEIIYNEKPKLHLLTGSILLDSKSCFIQSSKVVKNLY